MTLEQPDPFTRRIRLAIEFYRPLGMDAERFRKLAEYGPVWAQVFWLALSSCLAIVMIYVIAAGLPLSFRDRPVPTWIGYLGILLMAYYAGMPVISLLLKRRLYRRIQALRASYDNK